MPCKVFAGAAGESRDFILLVEDEKSGYQFYKNKPVSDKVIAVLPAELNKYLSE